MSTNQPEHWLFSSPDYTFFTVMSPLFFEMHFALLHSLFCGPCNLFCTTNDLFNVPVFSCAPSAIWYEISIHFLKICCWIECTFLKYHKEEKDTFFELQLFLNRIMFKIIKWLNKTKGTHLMNKWNISELAGWVEFGLILTDNSESNILYCW